MTSETATLRLKPAEDRRLRQGHVWVFSNEVDVDRTPLTDMQPGQLVIVENNKGKTIGSGYVNPNTLICARLYSRAPGVDLSRALITQRLRTALALRERLYDAPYYRWVFAESDGLPGLIVDRYGDVIAIQINTAGMERVQDDIIAAIRNVVDPRAILLRHETSGRAMEGLEQYVRWVDGSGPERVIVKEHGAEFNVDLFAGQKTGWFYDQRANRARMRAYVRDQRVLDVFSYVGAWGVQAALAGAKQVVCVDSSQAALDQVLTNAQLNGVERRVSIAAGDAFDMLKALRAEREKFDVVIIDPPALIKRKKDLKEGIAAYHHLNQLALHLVADNGILISCSCSYHLPRSELMDVIHTAGRHCDRELQILEQLHHGPDHPVHPAIPETEYLKAYVARAWSEAPAT
jgi:23S rRNA (cytosine1962-C5)-methyltransferase